MKILIVDDSAAVREPMELHLGSVGYEIESASDGVEALDLIRREDFDLVITDIRMPNMDGLELLRRLSALKPGLDVVIITGYADMDSSIEALRLGAENFLLKPVNLVELAHAAQIVEKKQAMARRLKEQEILLTQARKMADLGIVAAGVAHEINNPNTFVRGNLQTLKKYWSVIEEFILEAKAAGVEPAAKLDMIIREMPGMFGALLEGTDRIKSIVENTTAFTRLNSGNSINGVDLNQCVAQALEYQTIKGKEPAVVTHLETNLPQVGGARDELVDVIVELVKNSLKAVEGQENPFIEIRTFLATPERIHLQIKDNGPGIQEKYRDRIFTPFFSTDSRIGRPGLGLSKAYALVTGFGGEIHFDSEEGGGARFTVQLPIYNERIHE